MIDNKTVFAWVFARGGSKGLPGKNTALLAGVPLVGRAIQAGLASKYVDKVFVSTDSPEIAEVAKSYGAEVPFLRPAELASDEVPERLAWRHAIDWLASSKEAAMDIMVSLPATAPFRNSDDVDRSICKFAEESWDTVVSVTRSSDHPSFNMVTQSHLGAVSLMLPPDGRVSRRQACKPVFVLTGGVYVTAPAFVMRSDSFWEGSVGSVEVPIEHAVDVDDASDFAFAEFLVARNLKDKKQCF